ncbi:hypothetical protein [Ralstonia insidiosa]|uniref:Uncharacterized protein n=1 Tax=Ralstonia insidiosa TaxID=190721 RepID=A0A848P9V5_9RALS|nr:hypothetical protein [Ralstonia insidiosa]NMV41993.1 hypothetical protein [Ralstonia insidiosa]
MVRNIKITGDQKIELSNLIKTFWLVAFVLVVMVVFVPKQWRPIIGVTVKVFSILIVFRILYIFSPWRDNISRLWDKFSEVHATLAAEQKLYINVCLVASFYLLVLVLEGKPVAGTYAELLLLFSAYVVFYDILRWYRQLSEHLFGKALIALTFAAMSNLAYSFAGQVVAQVIHVVPTGFVRTTLFIAIMMIPVLMTLIGGVVFAGGIIMSSLIMIFSMFGNFDPRIKRWLFAGTLPDSSLKFPIPTRIFQVIFYSIIGYMLFLAGKSSADWYEKEIFYLTPRLIYHFDMYRGLECNKLGEGYKLAVLGDSKYLLGKLSKSGDVSFDPPVKCDSLPAR